MTTEALQRVSIPSRQATRNGSFARRKILLLGDDTETLAFFRDVFAISPSEAAKPHEEGRRYELDIVSNAAGALEQVKNAVAAGEPYTLVFLDGDTYSGNDSADVSLNILATDPDAHVAICTGQDARNLDELVRKVGTSDRFLIIRKPFDAVRVKQLVTALASKWEMARHFREANHRWHESEQCHLFITDELETRVIDRTAELAAIRLRLEHMLRSARR